MKRVTIHSDSIDFVIPWVNGNDPEWIKEKSNFEKQSEGDRRDIRFRDWDNLRYWFRAVEAYAPWVNRIHFITWGHLPEWLNTAHPKLNIVTHQDYIPQAYLPTFNSHTIELNMHRIPELADQFVYFNDDVFLNAPVKPSDFFLHGLPRDIFAQDAIYFGPDSVGAINGNNLKLINTHFSKKNALLKNWTKWYSPAFGIRNLMKTSLLLPWPGFPGFLYKHTTTNLLKSTLETVWAEETECLDRTCRCRFRQPTNVNQWVFKYWQLATGRFVPMSHRFSHCYHIKDSVTAVCQSISDQKYAITCINDTARTQNFEKLALEIKNAFAEKFPKKSRFEL